MPEEATGRRDTAQARGSSPLLGHSASSLALPTARHDAQYILPELPSFLPDFRKVASQDAARVSYMCDVLYAREYVTTMALHRCAEGGHTSVLQSSSSALLVADKFPSEGGTTAEAAQETTSSTTVADVVAAPTGAAAEAEKAAVPSSTSALTRHGLSELDLVVQEQLLQQQQLIPAHSSPSHDDAFLALTHATTSPAAREAFVRVLPHDSIFALELESQAETEAFCHELVRGVVEDSAEAYTRRCFDAMKEAYTALSTWDELRESVARSFLTQDVNNDEENDDDAKDGESNNGSYNDGQRAVVCTNNRPPRLCTNNTFASMCASCSHNHRLRIQVSAELLLRMSVPLCATTANHAAIESSKKNTKDASSLHMTPSSGDVPPPRMPIDEHSRYVLNTLDASSAARQRGGESRSAASATGLRASAGHPRNADTSDGSCRAQTPGQSAATHLAATRATRPLRLSATVPTPSTRRRSWATTSGGAARASDLTPPHHFPATAALHKASVRKSVPRDGTITTSTTTSVQTMTTHAAHVPTSRAVTRMNAASSSSTMPRASSKDAAPARGALGRAMPDVIRAAPAKKESADTTTTTRGVSHGVLPTFATQATARVARDDNWT